MALDSEDYVGGIEDGMLGALQTAMSEMGVNNFGTYSGDLDAENLKNDLAAFAAKCPRVLVAYAEGVDTMDPRTAPIGGNVMQFRHDCHFTVIVASNDSRSEKIRRRGATDALGVYTMIAKVRETLSGLTIRKTVDEVPQMLTFLPLMPIGNAYKLRIPDLTAYAVYFGTFFKWKSPDRTAAGTAVSTLDLAVDGIASHGAHGVASRPGVEFKT